jgi:hypothetical protein
MSSTASLTIYFDISFCFAASSKFVTFFIEFLSLAELFFSLSLNEKELTMTTDSSN